MTSNQLSDWLRSHGNSTATVTAVVEEYEAVQITVADGTGETIGRASGWTIELACERLRLPEGEK